MNDIQFQFKKQSINSIKMVMMRFYLENYDYLFFIIIKTYYNRVVKCPE